MSGKLQVLERGTDIVLAEHYTPVYHGRLTAAALGTVTFDRPHRIGFRLVPGPVPHITEEFALTDHDGTTSLDNSAELGGWGMKDEVKAMEPEEVTRLVAERFNAGDAAGVAALYEPQAVLAYPAGR